jgi:acyl carrier protein
MQKKTGSCAAATLNVLEKELKTIVSSIINTTEFGITDPFGDLGFTSLSGIRLAMQLYKRFNVQMNARKLLSEGSIQSVENEILTGLRRDLTREIFEDLAALQCEKEEILGYIGTTPAKLDRWCRRIYHKDAAAMLAMIRMDGLIAIRRASFDQLKKSATLVAQQYNRFLPDAGADRQDASDPGGRDGSPEHFDEL